MVSSKRVQGSDENVYYLYQRIGHELQQELTTLEKLTDLIQVFKDNDTIALRQIYESGRKKNHLTIVK